MSQSELLCPFCEQTSARPQGLAAHIRSRHPKQYPRWLKTPTRLTDAQNGAAPPKGIEPINEEVGLPHGDGGEPVSAPAVVTNPTLDLLKKAHEQLAGRKQSIEAELARFAELTKELDTVNTQIEALDKALGVFV